MTLAPAIHFPRINLLSESRSEEARDSFFVLLEQQALSYSAMDWLPTIAARLEEIRKECSMQNWDGEDAQAITAEVLSVVESIVRSFHITMPRNIPAPDLIPENDGEVCLSWDLADGRSFSISVGLHGKMNYAGQLGKKGVVHGWQPIDISDHRAFRETIQEVARQIVKLYA
jgi:hypothetical protein